LTTSSRSSSPNCTAESDGRFRYRVHSFGTGGNDVPALPPLELYLMGLLPLSEVPSPISVLEDATTLDELYDRETSTEVVEAAGIRAVTTQEITDALGVVTELPQGDRAFTAAFVVLSATPASDAVLDLVGTYVAGLSGAVDDPHWPSFEKLTGGRATVDTTLGPRLPIGTAPPALRVPKHCDVYAQDCGSARACYYFSPDGGLCGISRGGTRDEACTRPSDCAPGLTCERNAGGDKMACEPYCNPDTDADDYCGLMCPLFYYTDSDDMIVAGACQAPS
jgi:hypothetical protein